MSVKAYSSQDVKDLGPYEGVKFLCTNEILPREMDLAIITIGDGRRYLRRVNERRVTFPRLQRQHSLARAIKSLTGRGKQKIYFLPLA